jgi:N-acetylglucosaminyldiphosphoundecaprenol N-acetyl-beta-D-mannosaminyltransferase
MTALAHAIATTRVRLLGGVVDPITPGEMLAATEAFVAGGGTAVIANHNSHRLFLLRRTPALRAFFDDADLVQIDSRPMILWARLMRLPVSGEHRSTYLDWRDDFWATVRDRGWRVFHVGGAPGVGERAAAEFAHPALNLGLELRRRLHARLDEDGETP